MGEKGWKAGGSEAIKLKALTLLLGFLLIGELNSDEQSPVVDIPFSPPIVDGNAT